MIGSDAAGEARPGSDGDLMDGAFLSATVIVTRDGFDGLEVLMVRRSADLVTHGGAWAFPGGRSDPVDRQGADRVATAHRTGVREVREETGLDLGEADLTPTARWVTPLERPRRYDAHFFHSHLDRDQPAVADGVEIVEAEWVRPTQALADGLARRRTLPGPTAITLRELATFESSVSAAESFRRRSPREFVPHTVWDEEGVEIHLYREDAGFSERDHGALGPRHRMIRQAGGMRYEWSEEATRIPVHRWKGLVERRTSDSPPQLAWVDDGRRFTLESGREAWELLRLPSPPEHPRDPLLMAAEMAELSLREITTVAELARAIQRSAQ